MINKVSKKKKNNQCGTQEECIAWPNGHMKSELHLLNDLTYICAKFYFNWIKLFAKTKQKKF